MNSLDKVWAWASIRRAACSSGCKVVPFPLTFGHVTPCNHSPFARFFALTFRTLALAAAAFFARAVRSAGVMVSRLRLPPILPAADPCFFPSFRKYSDTAAGTFFFAISTA